MKRLLLFFSIFILTQDVFSMTEEKSFDIRTHENFIKVQKFYEGQKVRLRYLNTISDFLGSNIDINSKFKIAEKYHLFNFKEYFTKSPSLTQADYIQIIRMECERYRLLRNYMQNIALNILQNYKTLDSFLTQYKIVEKELCEAWKCINSDYESSQKHFPLLQDRNFLAKEEAVLLTAQLLEFPKLLKIVEHLTDSPETLKIIGEDLAEGTTERHRAAISSAKEINFRYQFSDIPYASPPIFSKEYQAPLQKTMVKIISVSCNYHLSKKNDILHNPAVLDEYLARLATLILVQSTPLEDDKLLKLEDEIESIPLQAKLDIRNRKRERERSTPIPAAPIIKNDFTTPEMIATNLKLESMTLKKATGYKNKKRPPKNKKGRRKGKKLTPSPITPLGQPSDSVLKPVAGEKGVKNVVSAITSTPAPALPSSISTLPPSSPVVEVIPVEEEISFTIYLGYVRTPYEEYVKKGGCNREWMVELKKEHDEFYKGRVEPVKMTIATSPFNDLEKQFLKDIIFGPMSVWKRYSWNDIENLLRDAGWTVNNKTKSSSVHFTPRSGLHSIIGNHTISVHQDHTPNKHPVAFYCVEFLKMAFKNSYGIEETDIKKS